MVSCQHLVSGKCVIASQISEHLVGVAAHESSCEQCLKTDSPKDKNKVTCGLAVLALSKAKLLDVNQHSHLLRCSGASVDTRQDVRNRTGTALAIILGNAGVYERNSGEECGCSAYAKLMDSWGWAGCVDRKQEIVQHLNLQKASWMDMIKVALAGYLTTESLVDEALFRSNPNHV